VLVEIAAGLVWLAVGTLGLGADGVGTLILAIGIAVAIGIGVENRRRGPRPFDTSRSTEVLRLAAGVVVIVIVASIVLGLLLVGAGLLSALVSTMAAGGFVSQGLLGLLAGVVILLSAADRVGLVEMLRDR
jgi:hypothetical protein